MPFAHEILDTISDRRDMRSPTHDSYGDRVMIVFVPGDAEQQIEHVLRNRNWTVGESGDRPSSSDLAAMAHEVIRLMRDWKTQSDENADRLLSEKRALSPIGPDVLEIDQAQLVPGRVINRYCEAVRSGLFTTVVPCCERAIRLSRDAEHAVCCSCLLAYTVTIYDEGDDGWGNPSYLAIFTVAHDVAATHNQRRTRR
ncbi:hypothetical protein [Kutzneria sp. NPDC051319]|uniref:hypothetical protein n=1 Tax=Kutzneria sp. NPDC051319 TaxID=3155047 RepID=UPI00341C57A9